ncbi:hypothetical protein [Streptomyces sp. NTH33]|uniref:hypothetical protein n=1 Tax=Streptomyces sp. NTH33 TaxID=1735453 RepID=UPI0011B93E43|nr:hypothetical protein [Streptomyces sp. NTH33]
MSRGIFFVQRAVARPVVGGLAVLLLGLVPAGATSAVARDIGWNVVEGSGRDIGWNGSGA